MRLTRNPFTMAFLSRLTGTVCVMVLALCAGQPAQAEGFPVGHLLATDGSHVYAIDPATGGHQVLTSAPLGFSDIVFNPVTGSAFITKGADLGSTVVFELTWSGDAGFAVSTFLDGLVRAKGLAVDSDGNLYIGEATQRILKVDLTGRVTTYTAAAPGFLFVPQYLALSPDESKLYVSVSPSNQIDVLDLSDGTFSQFVEEIDFPGGLDVAPDGTVYANEQILGDGDRVVEIAADGTMTTYSVETWMRNLWQDLEYDDRDGTIYVGSAFRIYAIDPGRIARVVFTSLQLSAMEGLDIITPHRPRATAARETWTLY